MQAERGLQAKTTKPREVRKTKSRRKATNRAKRAAIEARQGVGSQSDNQRFVGRFKTLFL